MEINPIHEKVSLVCGCSSCSSSDFSLQAFCFSKHGQAVSRFYCLASLQAGRRLPDPGPASPCSFPLVCAPRLVMGIISMIAVTPFMGASVRRQHCSACCCMAILSCSEFVYCAPSLPVSTTFTGMSGVKKELKLGVPLYIELQACRCFY